MVEWTGLEYSVDNSDEMHASREWSHFIHGPNLRQFDTRSQLAVLQAQLCSHVMVSCNAALGSISSFRCGHGDEIAGW